MKAKLRVIRCKNCKQTFEQVRYMQYVCCSKCAYEYQNTLKLNKKNKEERKEMAELKEKLLTHKDYIKMLQTVFNTYIRLRDKDENCISCDTPMINRKGDASHYYPTTYQYLRFNEDNVHLSCVTCNQFKHGNISEYTPRLELKIGKERLQYLHDNRHNTLNLSIPDIKEKIIFYKNKIKNLK